MATKITIGNKTTSVPGVYSTIRSGIINPPSEVDYGNVVIIDDGKFSSSNYIAINGVLGQNKQGLDSVMEFTEFAETSPYIWDSELLPVVKSLFKPSKKNGVSGVNKLTIIQASETTSATASITFSKGSLSLDTVFEGASLNGDYKPKTYIEDEEDGLVVTSNELSKGLAFKLEPGRAFGYSLVFYRGIHDRDEDSLNPGFGYNESPLTDIYANVSVGNYNIVKPKVLFRSPDLRRLSELKKWMERSNDFKRWFSIKTFTFNPTDDFIVAGDITSNQTALAPYRLFSGATTQFTTEAFSAALDVTKSLDNTFYLALGHGQTGDDLNNTSIVNLLTSGTLNWEKYAFIGGYSDSSNFLGELDSSEYLAKYYNTSKAILVHGAAKVANSYYPNGYRNISTLEKAAKVLGRTAGLPPQTPVTWKDINISAEVHKLTESEKEAAMNAGILCTYYDSELSSFVILAGINTLGDNDFLINEGAQSYSIAVERTKSQINKELIFGAKRSFFSKEEGPNRNTCSPQDLVTWTTGFLNSKVATNEKDNLIIRVGVVTAAIHQDNIYINYEIVPNTDISKLIFVGVLLDN